MHNFSFAEVTGAAVSSQSLRVLPAATRMVEKVDFSAKAIVLSSYECTPDNSRSAPLLQLSESAWPQTGFNLIFLNLTRLHASKLGQQTFREATTFLGTFAWQP